MQLKDLLQTLDARFLSEEKDLEKEITGGYVSDLLSDVMGSAESGQVWVTIMRHLNVVAVASLTGVAAILFSNKMQPEDAVIEKANSEGINLLATDLSTFEAAGRLYTLLQQG